MRTLRLSSIFAAVLVSVVAAAPVAGQPIGIRPPPKLLRPFEGKAFYVCCHLRFDLEGNATDANLNYAFPEFMIPSGTKVSVTGTHSGTEITMKPTGGSREFTLKFKYGRDQGRGSSVDYYRRILLTSDPTRALADMPAGIRTAIARGRLKLGMSREQAIMARGYPPLHHTNGVEASEWIHYFSNDLVDVVRFVDGKIDSVERGPAP